MSRQLIKLRFDESTPLCWRSDGSFVIGYTDQPESRALRVVQQPREVAVWLSLVDGSRNAAQLVVSAQAMGINESAIRLLLQQLLEAGHVYEVATARLPADSIALSRDLRYNGGLRALAADELAARRSGSKVLVHGAGGLAAGIFRRLREQHISVGWDPAHPGSVRPQDLPELGEVTPSSSPRWSKLAVKVTKPDLVVAVADAHDLGLLTAQFAQTPTLLVSAHRLRISVGPILNVVGACCPYCLNAARSANDTDWNFVLTQLLHRHRPLPVIGNPWLALAAEQVCALVCEIVDSGWASGLVGQSLELVPPDPIWRARSWKLSQTCESCSLGLAK